MSYLNHFQLADAYLSYLDQNIDQLANPYMASSFTGFLAVTAVTVFELAIRAIFTEFAHKKHKVLGNFTEVYFSRINGRIRAKNICEDYLNKFGDKYLKRFKKNIENCERTFLKAQKVSVKNAYENIITWRNEFAHEGRIPANPTYDEVKRSYINGKNFIICLAETMR